MPPPAGDPVALSAVPSTKVPMPVSSSARKKFSNGGLSLLTYWKQKSSVETSVGIRKVWLMMLPAVPGGVEALPAVVRRAIN